MQEVVSSNLIGSIETDTRRPAGCSILPGVVALLTA